jgi:trehalose 6-phosphate synthase
LAGKSRKTRQKLTEKYISSDYKYLCLSVERVDYIKGTIERLKAIDRFLEKYPEYQKKFVYLGIAPRSRMRIPMYQNLLKDTKNLVEKINWKYYTDSWYPVSFTDDIFSIEELIPFYKNADICMVNSLDDGMNIVAKEFVAAADPERGMLVLSQFTGTARELSDAVLVNPYDVEQMADAIKSALEMPTKERIERMNKMKEIIKDRNVYRWASKFILELSGLKVPPVPAK